MYISKIKLFIKKSLFHYGIPSRRKNVKKHLIGVDDLFLNKKIYGHNSTKKRKKKHQNKIYKKNKIKY